MGLSPNQPQAAIGDSGRIHVVFGIADTVQYAGSTNGNTFEKSRLAFQVPNMALGMRRGPRIASTGDVIVVTAIGGKIGKGHGDILAWQSRHVPNILCQSGNVVYASHTNRARNLVARCLPHGRRHAHGEWHRRC